MNPGTSDHFSLFAMVTPEPAGGVTKRNHGTHGRARGRGCIFNHTPKSSMISEGQWYPGESRFFNG
jgi:hypothetical protein